MGAVVGATVGAVVDGTVGAVVGAIIGAFVDATEGAVVATGATAVGCAHPPKTKATTNKNEINK